MDITYGVADADDREALWALGRQAFGNSDPYDPDLPTADLERVQVARVDGRPVAKVAALDLGQFIQGARFPMAGITGVTAGAQVTGRGATKRLLAASLHDAVERGETIAALFPTTASLYRSVGFEMAGGWARRALPVAELRRDADPTITVEIGDETLLRDAYPVYRRQAERSNGWIDRSDAQIARHMHFGRRDAEKKSVNAYRAVRDGHTVALAITGVEEPSKVANRFYDLRIDSFWGDPDGLTALAAVIAGYGTVAGEIQVLLPRHELGALTLQPQHSHVITEFPWMVRVLDVGAALSARPAPELDGEVHLRVDDPLLAANNGDWVLRSAGGTLLAERGGKGTVGIAVTDLAAVFTGFQRPSFLAASGALPGADDRAVAWLTSAFAAPEPTMVDFF